MIYTAIIVLFIIQRLFEMKKGKENLKRLESENLISLSHKERIMMILLHSLFFISCLTEYFIRGKVAPAPLLIGACAILLLTQSLRFKTMRLLGIYWTPYPLAFKRQIISFEGPYRLIRHPNYLAVVIEIILLPLIGSCYFTAVVFSLLNFLFLKRRMDTEEMALNLLPQYELGFKDKKRLIPLLY